jgi:hypothetical protein
MERVVALYHNVNHYNNNKIHPDAGGVFPSFRAVPASAEMAS